MLIQFNLMNEFKNNPEEAINKAIEEAKKLRENNIEFITESDHKEKIIKFKEFLQKISEEEFQNFKEMYIIYSVTFLESIINNHISLELTLKKQISQEEINKNIIRNLSIKQKISWFFEIINDRNFIKEKPNIWKNMKQIIDIRNDFVHEKPKTLDKKYNKNIEINKKIVLDFIDNCVQFEKYCDEIRTEDIKQYLDLKEAFREYLKERK